MTVVTNWGQAILSALANALNLILAFIPRLFGFVIILLVGWLIATLVSQALTHSSEIHEFLREAGMPFLQRVCMKHRFTYS